MASSSPIKRTVSTTSSQSSPTSSTLSKSISDVSSQTLTSVLNNPHSNDAVWSSWWSTSTTPTEFSPINYPSTAPTVTKQDFSSYLASVSDAHYKFDEIRKHKLSESIENSIEGEGGQGEALVACLREVPSLYFKGDFRLEDGATFKAACPFSSVSENLVLQEKLSQYLDVVEMHLVKEISIRSSSFYEAQGQLEDLNSRISEGCERIRELKQRVRVLDKELIGSARKVQELNVKRGDLLGIQQKLKLVFYVNQAVSALKLVINCLRASNFS